MKKKFFSFLVALMLVFSCLPTISYAEDSPSITSHPIDTCVAMGKAATFSVRAEGEDLQYLWQYKLSGADQWIDWTSKTTPDIAIAYKASRNGMSVRCVVTDGIGRTAVSNPAILSYGGIITISKQPQNVVVETGKAAVFFVEAQGSGLQYLWRYQLAGTTNWIDWTSKTTPEIAVGYKASRNNMLLKCVITDSTGISKETDTVSLTYGVYQQQEIVIVKQPQNAVVETGKAAVFSVEATGSGLQYLWQYQTVGTTNWIDWTSKTTPEIAVGYKASRDNMLLRCVITDDVGNSIESDTVSLSYRQEIKIVKQPQNAVVEAGKAAVFSVEATGSGLQYQWQYQLAGTTKWVDWTSKTTPEIAVGYKASRDNMLLRCVITDDSGNTHTSDTALLSYGQVITIINQPQHAVVETGKAAVFSIDAIGSGLQYLWQYQLAGTTKWVDWTSKTTPEIAVGYKASRNNMLLRCVLTDASGYSKTSDSALLTYGQPVRIVRQPTYALANLNSEVYFTISAIGNDPEYEWQYSADQQTWVSTGSTEASYSFTVTNENKDYYFRCVVTDGSQTVTSNTVRVEVEQEAYAPPTNLTLSTAGTLSFTTTEAQPHVVMLGVYQAPATGTPTLLGIIPFNVDATGTYTTKISNFFTDSGSYYIVAKAVGSVDEENAQDMTVGSAVTSNTVTYTKPTTVLSAPTGTAWISSSGQAYWDAVENAASYQVMLYSNNNLVSTCSTENTTYDFSSSINSQDSFTFSVKAISQDITSVANSPESGRSSVLQTSSGALAWGFEPAFGMLTLAGSGAMADYNSVEETPWFAFKDSILSVQFNGENIEIGDHAFEGLNISSVDLTNVIGIGDCAFKNCSNIQGAVHATNVTWIGEGSFENCSNITSVYLGDNITVIGDYAFDDCRNLTTFSVLDNSHIVGNFRHHT